MDTQLNESYQVCFTAHHDQLFEPAVAHASFSESFPAATTSDRPCEVANLSKSNNNTIYLSLQSPPLPAIHRAVFSAKPCNEHCRDRALTLHYGY